MHLETDVLIIGCGIAGAAAALRLAQDQEREILVITRAPDPEESNSRYAQGGIVSRGDEDDTPELLAQDIEAAGAGLTWPEAARLLAEDGPELVNNVLINEAGVAFLRAFVNPLVVWVWIGAYVITLGTVVAMLITSFS